MICALRSAFYRFFKTGLYLKTLVLTAVLSFLTAGVVFLELAAFYSFSRPRYLDNEFVQMSLLQSLFTLPFVIAVFTMMFTGSDISYRSINNKIATGLPRIHIYLADLIVTLVATLMNYALYMLITLAIAIYWPVKSFVKFDKELVNSLILVLITCISFATLYVLLQYFFSNKLFAIIIALLILPCMPVVTGRIKDKLDVPYRYEVKDKDSGESHWELNPKYIGGTARNVLTAVYNSSVFNMDIKNLHAEQYVASGIVVILSTTAGLASVSKKEFS